MTDIAIVEMILQNYINCKHSDVDDTLYECIHCSSIAQNSNEINHRIACPVTIALEIGGNKLGE